MFTLFSIAGSVPEAVTEETLTVSICLYYTHICEYGTCVTYFGLHTNFTNFHTSPLYKKDLSKIIYYVHRYGGWGW